MSERSWSEALARAIGIFLSGDALGVDQRGEPISDSTFYMLLNADPDDVEFRLPGQRWGRRWQVVLDTRVEAPPTIVALDAAAAVLPEPADPAAGSRAGLAAGSSLNLAGRSLVLLERVA